MKAIKHAIQMHINKYIEHFPNKPIITSMKEKGTDTYENAHAEAVAIEVSRRRDSIPSPFRMCCMLKACLYKKSRKSGPKSVVIQSALC